MRRIRSPGPLLAAAGAVVLVTAMFLPWYRIRVTGGSVPGADRLRTSGTLNAWEVFAWIDMALFTAAVVALAAAALKDAPAPIGPRLVAVAGLGASALIAWRLVDSPLVAGEVFTSTVTVSLRLGAFLGLAGALMVAAGGAAAARART